MLGNYFPVDLGTATIFSWNEVWFRWNYSKFLLRSIRTILKVYLIRWFALLLHHNLCGRWITLDITIVLC